DRVQHDADTFRELIQKRDVNFGELLEGGQLHDGLHFTFEQHRQNDDGGRSARTEARLDFDVAFGNVTNQDALLLPSALADQAFPETKLRRGLFAIVGVASHELKDGGSAIGAFSNVKGAALCAHQRCKLGQQKLSDGEQVALALHHAREFRNVGL